MYKQKRHLLIDIQDRPMSEYLNICENLKSNKLRIEFLKEQLPLVLKSTEDFYEFNKGRNLKEILTSYMSSPVQKVLKDHLEDLGRREGNIIKTKGRFESLCDYFVKKR